MYDLFLPHHVSLFLIFLTYLTQPLADEMEVRDVWPASEVRKVRPHDSFYSLLIWHS